MKTLIIGGSGFLGSRLTDAFGATGKSTYHQNKVFTNQIQLDLRDADAIQRCLDEERPGVIIHCGGLTSTDICEANQGLANKINCTSTSELTKRFDGKMIYFSTDYVFDGESAPYDENSNPNPINHYGQTKLVAERIVLGKPQNLVVRVSGLYGYNKHNNRFLDGLRSQKVIKANNQYVSTPTYIEDIVQAIPSFIKMSGILHFSGEQEFSRYKFVKFAVERLGLPTKVIAQEVDFAVKRPKNSSLVSIYNLRKTPIGEAFRVIGEAI